MKYLKYFERRVTPETEIDELSKKEKAKYDALGIKVGDYVKFLYDPRYKNKIYEVDQVDLDLPQMNYLLYEFGTDDSLGWVHRHDIELATELEIAALKYNL